MFAVGGQDFVGEFGIGVGDCPGDALRAVKATALTALTVGVERSMAVAGPLVETDIEELPADSFPQLRRLQHVVNRRVLGR